MIRPNFLLPLRDDGLATPEVGPWVEDKYRLVGLYNRLFSTGMKSKWDCRVYIDLFAGAGRSKIRGTKRIIPGSPLLALSVPDRFDKYIFCEEDGELLEILERRVRVQFPGVDIEYVHGDCNVQVEEICLRIPLHSRTKKVLSFCFVDPFDIGIQFETIRLLSKRFIDFLVVLAVGMDATRNEANYTRPENPRVDRFLGSYDWRERWRSEREKTQGLSFRHFLAQEYASRMESLEYIRVPLHKMKVVRSVDKNLPLYHLALFSRNKLGYRYWDQVLKYGVDEQMLPFPEEEL
jgi:three-Cys-motif partner protein